MTEITFHENDRLSDIQKKFTEHFPLLKLEFYSRAHEEGEGSNSRNLLDATKTLGEVRSIRNEGHISIHGNQKVSTLEQSFEDNYGLHVQVFRKSGSIWLQTTATDDWTLSQQNETALEFQV